MLQTQNQLIPDESVVALSIETSGGETAAVELVLKWLKKHIHRLLFWYAIRFT
nr:DNA repair protein RAD51 homolog 3-like [Ipomoea batatas]